MTIMEYITNWQEKNLRCYYCGETRSVKYKEEIIDPVISSKPTTVCVCNKCAIRNVLKWEIKRK